MDRHSTLQLVVVIVLSLQSLAQGKEAGVKHPTLYRTVQVDGLSIFYREAGPKDAPVLLLLHGLPSSSRMFEPLFARLSDRYHLVAPIILDTDTANGRIRRNLPTGSIASPRL
jgi:hypothetical protein